MIELLSELYHKLLMSDYAYYVTPLLIFYIGTLSGYVIAKLKYKNYSNEK